MVSPEIGPSGEDIESLEPIVEDDDTALPAYLDPVAVYSHEEAMRHPLLTREEEVDLAKRMEQGRNAGERLEPHVGRPISQSTRAALKFQVAAGVQARGKRGLNEGDRRF